MREAAVPSLFLSELPESLVQGTFPRVVERRYVVSSVWTGSRVDRGHAISPYNAVRRRRHVPPRVGAGRW